MKFGILKLISAILIILSCTFFVSAQTAREKGIKLYQEGKYKEAINSLEIVLRNNEKDAEVLNYLGLAYLGIEKYKDARNAFEKAVKASPQNSNFRSNLAYSYLLMRKIDKSQNEIKEAIKLDPNNSNAYYIRGMSYFLENNYKKAASDGDKAISLNNSLVSAYILKTDALIFSFGENWENRYNEENINSIALAIKVLQDCSAECKKKDESNLIQDKLESLKTFYAYLQKKEINTSDGLNEPVNDNKTQIKLITKPQPSYTDSARQGNVQGTIKLAILFGSDGKIKFILVVKGLKNGLNEEAVKAAQKIKFEPATENGKPISVLRILEYTFTIY